MIGLVYMAASVAVRASGGARDGGQHDAVLRRLAAV
jgi:hypothetical protein